MDGQGTQLAPVEEFEIKDPPAAVSDTEDADKEAADNPRAVPLESKLPRMDEPASSTTMTVDAAAALMPPEHPEAEDDTMVQVEAPVLPAVQPPSPQPSSPPSTPPSRPPSPLLGSHVNFFLEVEKALEAQHEQA